MFLPQPFPEPSQPTTAWTLATYNVQDLFDATNDAGAHDEHPSENQVRNKLTRLGRVLHILNADVLGLMEVETLGILQRFSHDYLADLGYGSAILIEGNDPERGIDVALLSRFPVTRVVSHAADGEVMPGEGWRRIFSRDCLECHVQLPSGETLIVLVNHFKSKRGGLDETRFLRVAQAQRVRAIAAGLLPESPLLAVIGDLNDTPDSEPLGALVGPDLGLTDIALDVPEAHLYTFVHAGRAERIDYVLASAALTRRLVPDSVLIPHDTWAKRASDHFPIRAAFAIGQEAPSAGPLNLTVRYDAEHPPTPRGHLPPRINAARFFLQAIHGLAGRLVVVTGVVRRVEVTTGVGVARCFLGSDDPDRAFRVTIFPDAREHFREADIDDIAGYYVGKVTQGVGTLRFYQGHPEIAANHPHEFRIVSTKEI